MREGIVYTRSKLHSKVKTTFYLDADLRELMLRENIAMGETINDLLRRAFEGEKAVEKP